LHKTSNLRIQKGLGKIDQGIHGNLWGAASPQWALKLVKSEIKEFAQSAWVAGASAQPML
jgi:hypothetical protein